jgi:hypothetical protein
MPQVCYSAVSHRLAILTTGKVRPDAGVSAWVDTWDATTLKPGKTCQSDLSKLFPPEAKQDSATPTALAFDPAGRRLAATFLVAWESGHVQNKVQRNRLNHRGVVIVWNAETGEEVFRQPTLDPMRAVGFDPQGHVVAAGGSPAGGVLSAWDIETEERTLLLEGHTRGILAFAFGPNGRLATAGDRAVKVWDVSSRREVLTLDGFAREVTHVAFTADGKNLVAATGVDLLNAANVAGVPTDAPPAEVRVFRAPK